MDRQTFPARAHADENTKRVCAWSRTGNTSHARTCEARWACRTRLKGPGPRCSVHGWCGGEKSRPNSDGSVGFQRGRNATRGRTRCPACRTHADVPGRQRGREVERLLRCASEHQERFNSGRHRAEMTRLAAPRKFFVSTRWFFARFVAYRLRLVALESPAGRAGQSIDRHYMNWPTILLFAHPSVIPSCASRRHDVGHTRLTASRSIPTLRITAVLSSLSDCCSLHGH